MSPVTGWVLWARRWLLTGHARGLTGEGETPAGPMGCFGQLPYRLGGAVPPSQAGKRVVHDHTRYF